MQRREIDRHRPVAERGELRHRAFERCRIAGVAVELGMRRDADAQCRRQAGGADAEIAVGVERILALEHRQHRGRVLDRQREHRDAVEAATGRHDAAGRDPPGVGFRPTMLLKPAGTRPEPAVSVPRAKGTSPRATTTAEPELEPPLMRSAASAAARPAVGRAGADQAGGELVEVGLAHADRTGIDQLLHRRGVLQRPRLEGRAGGGGGEAGDVDVVLDRERHTEQGQGLHCRGAVGEGRGAQVEDLELRGKLGRRRCARSRRRSGSRLRGAGATPRAEPAVIRRRDRPPASRRG